MGTVYDRQERKEEAKKIMGSALAQMKRLNPDHPYAATISLGISRLMLETGNTKEAHSYVGDVLRIRTNSMRCCGEIHTQVGRCYQVLGDIAYTAGDMRSSHYYFLRSYKVLSMLIEREVTLQENLELTLENGMGSYVNNWKERQQYIEEKLDCIIEGMTPK